MQVDEVADAAKDRRGRAAALALAKTVKKLVVAKGKNLVTVDVDDLDDDTLAGYLLGPTGNLRAPTLRQGNTLYVGFNEDVYRELTR